ncbi:MULTISPECIES: terminase small subunit [Enterobacterales]|uniref:terminase small subunit n=1 Tax=Enterobacterales TaxID=91347 RepID=UPI00206A56C5|nr:MULTISPECIES: terminase small subunit [Enterobacterales]MDU5837749.1 terminase small subunit [Pantoea sp.]DAI70253.1 MAG TPA: Terminase small subunit [Bacteriophage sp.]DAL18032.1 MAG TPA_asm: Terminase small subunit [Caudoviricetes sp.]
MALTDKQEMFCREYLIDLNATQAAIRAGYSDGSARNQAHRLMTNDDILQRIAELNQDRLKRTNIDADYVLRQAVKLHERCMQEVEPLTDRRGEEITDEQGRTVYGFDAKGAVASLKLIGDHITVQAFKQQTSTEITGADGAPVKVDVTSMTPQEAAEQYKKLMG